MKTNHFLNYFVYYFKAELASPSETWNTNDFTPITEDSNKRSVSTYNWGDQVTNRKNADKADWDMDKMEPLEDSFDANVKLEEAKKKREEKKLQRQKEMEARRANRTTGGPMKLGAKKM